MFRKFIKKMVRGNPGQNVEKPGLNLMGNESPPLFMKNSHALALRPFMHEGYKHAHIKAQNQKFAELLRSSSYFGIVPVKVYGLDSFYMLSCNDDLVAKIYFYFGPDSYETLSVGLFAEFSRNASMVLDIGAYTGLFALLAAKANPDADVTAFEPMKLTAERIQDNAKLNGFTNIDVKTTAISANKGVSQFNVYGATFATTGASLQTKPNNKQLNTVIEIQTERLDDLYHNEKLDLIKLDTEKDEINALKGGKEMIKRCQPILFIEVLDKESVKTLCDFLNTLLQYSFYFIDDNNVELIEINEAFFDLPFQYGNMVCLPDKKIANHAIKFSNELKNKLHST